MTPWTSSGKASSLFTIYSCWSPLLTFKQFNYAEVIGVQRKTKLIYIFAENEAILGLYDERGIWRWRGKGTDQPIWLTLRYFNYLKHQTMS